MKAKKTKLYNQLDRSLLEKKIAAEDFQRNTISFYKYVNIEDPHALRDSMYTRWNELGVLGRIYVAKEGVNAQFSVPTHNEAELIVEINTIFGQTPLKRAITDDDDSFLKLIVKAKKKILADGQEDNSYDVTDVGKHMTAAEFNEAMKEDGTIVVDIRNRYESEIGHFKDAILPDVESFREELPVVKDLLKGQEDKKILLYCTGGIRCEKTSSWLRDKGYKDVNQLHGGIIDYHRQVQEQGLENNFLGKNFVFDGRMAESIGHEVISSCHVCGDPSDTHGNCEWQACHILFIRCEKCVKEMQGCCSEDCQSHLSLPMEEQLRIRKSAPNDVPGFFKSRKRPSAINEIPTTTL